MEKIAFLVIAHKNPDQVSRLCKRLVNENADVFVHWDSGAGVPNGEFPGHHFSKYKGMLNDRSLVDIANLLIDEALEFEKQNAVHFSYYALLSGQDYPLKSTRAISEELERLYPKAFIDVTPISQANWLGAVASHCRFFALTEPKLRMIKPALFRKALKAPIVLIDKLLSPLFSASARAKGEGIQIFGGSAWWVLPDCVVSEIVIRRSLNDATHLFARSVYRPEEVYFQTMLMSGPYSSGIKVNSIDEVEQNCKTYANFAPPLLVLDHLLAIHMHSREQMQRGLKNSRSVITLHGNSI